jgi:hypothetical protein
MRRQELPSERRQSAGHNKQRKLGDCKKNKRQELGKCKQRKRLELGDCKKNKRQELGKCKQPKRLTGRANSRRIRSSEPFTLPWEVSNVGASFMKGRVITQFRLT